MSSVRARLQRHLIRRRRKLTILLRAKAPSEDSPKSPIPSTPPAKSTEDSSADEGTFSDTAVMMYDLSNFVSVCSVHWTIWYREVQEERTRALGLVTQYPSPGNLTSMWNLETLCANMAKV